MKVITNPLCFKCDNAEWCSQTEGKSCEAFKKVDETTPRFKARKQVDNLDDLR